MIYDDKKIEIENVEAFYVIRKNQYITYIEICSKEGQRICFNFNKEGINPESLEKKQTINLIPYLYWDVTLRTQETYFLFDLTKDKVELTRLEDNLFNIKVAIEKPDMIYSPLGDRASFKNLFIDTNFSFCYEIKK